jgi:hypothetical protein
MIMPYQIEHANSTTEVLYCYIDANLWLICVAPTDL